VLFYRAGLSGFGDRLDVDEPLSALR